MENPNPYPPNQDPLDSALSAFARVCDSAQSAPDLADAIMSEIGALRSKQCVMPSPALRKFLSVTVADTRLQHQLQAAPDRSGFVRLLTRAGAARGFCFLKGEVYAFLHCFEIAANGELSDEQLDAVAAAAQSDARLMWELFRNKP